MIDFQFVNVPNINLSYIEGWFTEICNNENKSLSALTVVFGSDEWLLNYNKKYLNHDFYTDVITFDYCENNFISGDLLISIERINENAKLFNVSRETELNRVLVHGLLHLIGYDDKSEEDVQVMREKEAFYLRLLKN